MPVLDTRTPRRPLVSRAARRTARVRRAASSSTPTARDARVAELRARIAAGTYDPDASTVAAAILTRLLEGAGGGRGGGAEASPRQCS